MEPVPPTLELLGRTTVDIAAPLSLGRRGHGERRIVDILGGSIEGPRLRGEILPGGADWQVVRDAEVTDIEARYGARTHDGATLLITSRGVRRGPAEVIARIAAGEAVDPRDYYFRVNLSYETGDERYAWLNDLLVVGSAVRRQSQVIYDAYAVR